MEFTIPPDLEMLVNKRLSSGGYASVEDVLRRALEAQDADASRLSHPARSAICSRLCQGSSIDSAETCHEKCQTCGGHRSRSASFSRI